MRVLPHSLIMTNIQVHEKQYKFHHLTYLKESRFARQLVVLRVLGKKHISLSESVATLRIGFSPMFDIRSTPRWFVLDGRKYLNGSTLPCQWPLISLR